MKRMLSYSFPFILGILISNYIYNGKSNYSISWSMIFASIIGGLLAGILMLKLNPKEKKDD